MKVAFILTALLLFAKCEQMCKPIKGRYGLWITVSGKTYPCASTTNYYEPQPGSCGCGTMGNPSLAFPWQYEFFDKGGILTGAGNSYFFGEDYTWCGPKCGTCYQIVPTGGFVQGEGAAPKNMSPQIMMITNLCPACSNQRWCTSPNEYGYMAHFDLMNYMMNGEVTEWGWINPEVYFFPVDCPNKEHDDWEECVCACTSDDECVKNNNKQLLKCANNGQCVQCISNDDCGGTTPKCDNWELCVECLTDLDCSLLKRCVGGICTWKSKCVTDSDCPQSKPVCWGTNQECVECLRDDQCTNPNLPVCNCQHECVPESQCTTNAECIVPFPVCLNGTCVQCINNEECYDWICVDNKCKQQEDSI